MSKTIKEIAQLAAEWWATKVINPKMDNGDTSSLGFMGMMLARKLVEPVSEETKANFIKDLSMRIEGKLELDNTYDFILDVDYGPCRELREAAEIAGLSLNNFPIKTTMWISKNHVSVRYGYGANIEYLYANKAYWKSKIDSAYKTIEEYKSDNACYWIDDEVKRKQHCKEVIEDYTKWVAIYCYNYDKAEE